MPWVSYPFLKLSKSDISENVERDLISYTGLGRRGWFRDDAARAQPLDFVQLECEFFEKSSQADPEVIEEWTRRRVRQRKRRGLEVAVGQIRVAQPSGEIVSILVPAELVRNPPR